MYSMTKAITGVAAMILYEEGKFSLSDPVSKYLPEFTKMSVAQESFDAAGNRTYFTVPADRAITVRDLFRLLDCTSIVHGGDGKLSLQLEKDV
jgi:CubicO group peptidase (beta-lactamase class C family)